MGHSQMLLAVAGVKDEDLRKRTVKLASGDWSDFVPVERLAFGFAYQLSRSPAAVADRDVARLSAAFGPERAIDIIWTIAWANYMTRIADAFQLPLERDNVFAPPPKKP
jgi:alkylhydroperoxidase family enzyme